MGTYGIYCSWKFPLQYCLKSSKEAVALCPVISIIILQTILMIAHHMSFSFQTFVPNFKVSQKVTCRSCFSRHPIYHSLICRVNPLTSSGYYLLYILSSDTLRGTFHTTVDKLTRFCPCCYFARGKMTLWSSLPETVR